MQFVKMNGAGNDFVILNNFGGDIPPEHYSVLAKVLCERHLSIGADGLMIVVPPDSGGDFRMRFYNPDGTEGEMCGNGARCICRFAYETGLTGVTQNVETAAGMLIGSRVDARNYRVKIQSPSVIRPEVSVRLADRTLVCGYTQLGIPGIPHACVDLDTLPLMGDAELFELGRALRYASEFPKGANINFYRVLSPKEIALKTYERGVEDFTYACGTGSASTAMLLVLAGRCERAVKVVQRGGTLLTEVFDGSDGIAELYQTGPTNIVARGMIMDEELGGSL